MVKNPSRIALRVHQQQIVMYIIKLSSGHVQILTSTHFEYSHADSDLKFKGLILQKAILSAIQSVCCLYFHETSVKQLVEVGHVPAKVTGKGSQMGKLS